MTSLYNDNAIKIKEKLNSISDSFCAAKWTQVTLHLQNGFTHSCHHPSPHKIPLEELKNNPYALFNTSYKIEQRKMMINGERPKECQYCWNIENLGNEHLSDRHFKSAEYWSSQYIDQILSDPLSDTYLPTYLEVSFSNVCNLNCMYCSPQVSSKWVDDIKKHGPYDLGDFKHGDLNYLKSQEMLPIPERQENPYVDAFWNLWPQLYKKLRIFRITGGEPLLSKHTWKILEYIIENPNPNIEIIINTNLCVDDIFIEKLITIANDLIKNNKVKRFELYTSVESFGKQAEYIRYGLDFDKFIKNLVRVTTEIPMIKWKSKVVIMATYNILSIPGFRKLLDWLVYYRKTYSTTQWKNIWIDISYLRYPSWQAVNLVNEKLLEVINNDLEFMKSMNQDIVGYHGFQDTEIEKFSRMYQYAKNNFKNVNQIEKVRFYNFYRDYDSRKNLNFNNIFPELKEFMDDCRPN